MRGHQATIKQHAGYSSKEFSVLIVFGIFIGFIFSFNKWGPGATFEASTGLINLGYYIMISLFILFATTYVQKIVGAHIGIIPTFHFSLSSLIIPLVLLVFTGGAFPFFLLPGFSTSEHLSQMLGRNRYRRGFADYLQIGASGVLFMTGLGLLFSVPFFQSLFPNLNTTFFFFALYSLIPFDLILKPFDKNMGVSNGSAIAFCSRSIYVFTGLFLLFSFVLSNTELFFISLLLSILLAFILALLYFLYEGKIFGED